MSADRPWFEEWFDRDYLLVYGHRDARDAARGVALLDRVVAPRRCARALDLACGPGRHAALMAQRGLRVVGLDLSRTLLAEAQKLTGPPLPLVRSDMRELPFATAAFDLVACFFTSFGYFDEEGNARVLEEIARVLRPQGSLFLDYVNSRQVIGHLVPETRKSRGSTFILESRRYDETARRLVKTIEIQDGSRTRVRTESVRMYDADELTRMLTAARLPPETLLGDLQGHAFAAARSPRLVVHARRA